MNSKDKDNLSKLKQYFRRLKPTDGTVKERDLGSELERELRPETPVAQRCKTLKELGDFVLTTKLEPASVTQLWHLTKDLIVDNNSTEHRQTALIFYKKLIQGQYNNLSLMREQFFIVIQKHEVPEDLRHRLELLRALTENGKDISNFEEKIGRLMLDWHQAIVDANLTELYLDMLENIIKFNAAHLDHDIVVGIVLNACNLSCTVENTVIGLQCIKVLELVMCYAMFPNETLNLCVMTLCRTVNLVPYCELSWKNMKNLLGTDMGYSALSIMCSILNDKNYYEDAALLRGAVFHTNMGVFSLHTKPRLFTESRVLCSFLEALRSQKIIVTYEVIMSMQKLIPNYGKKLPEHIWDVICDILFAIADNIRHHDALCPDKEGVLQKYFHETLDIVESMLKNGEISANPERIYELIEKESENRPEASVLNLIEYRSQKITATRPEWLQAFTAFVQRFYRIPNTVIRVKTINSLVRIMDTNRAGYEEEILERVVIPQFAGIAGEPDISVRSAVGKALIDFALHCETKRCGEILDILEKLLNRSFELHATNGYAYPSEADLQDILTVVDGLIEIFVIKIYRLPSSHAIRIFDILVGHLEIYYQRKLPIYDEVNLVRQKIFTWMLKARANASYRLGFPDQSNSGLIRFSHYLGIDSSLPLHGTSQQAQLSSQLGQDAISSTNYSTISIRRACKIIVTALELERDFAIFQLVVKELPNILQNKALIQGNDIESLAAVMSSVYCRPPSYLQAKPTSDEFSTLLLPAIASLVIYHQSLSPKTHSFIIQALRSGIFLKVANICINTLTIMVLEMQDSLKRILPEVLLQLSKMSDTVNVAIPVLEFLSILIRLPNHFFANFVPKQYLFVFAICMPYTKPHRYDHYTVSLAHHVIAGWFVKCKLSMRKHLVKYIISCIQTNTSMLSEDIEQKRNLTRVDFNSLNEDSSNRKRSTSLTERGSRKTRGNPTDMRPLMNEGLKNFHSELTETCIDFLVRHTFSPCASLPKRIPAIEALLKDGPSTSWLVGHNLVTITTNGCPTPPTKNGLCARCQILSKGGSKPDLNESSASASSGENKGFEAEVGNRRYTKASLQYSSGTESGSTDLMSSMSSSSQHQLSSERSLRQTSNSSSGSLEALSRRGSNPDSNDNRETSLLSNSINHLNSASPQMPVQQQICARSCTGWAEVYIRRPTGNVSWVMRIQNPIENDCLGNDMPFHDLINMFIPSEYGGVFGSEFLSEQGIVSPQPGLMLHTPVSTPVVSPQPPPAKENVVIPNEPLPKREVTHIEQESGKRPLKRQEEISSSISTGPIDIPKTARRYKEPSGSSSDCEPDENDPNYDDGNGVRSRNPVRRVNSSPDMRYSVRDAILANKHIDGQTSHHSNAEKDIFIADAEQQQKKKGYTKDMRVSCEAIPEEIAGSTPPSQPENASKAVHLAEPKEMTLPPKQHSADDVTTQPTAIPVTVSLSTTSLKIPIDLQKITAKPPQLPTPLSPRVLAKNAASKVASFSSNVTKGNGSEHGADTIRARSKTISVVREIPHNNRPIASFRSQGTPTPTANSNLGINPSFVFLQLFDAGEKVSSDQPPIKLSAENMKAIALFDLIPPFEIHKIGVLYVGPGQCNNEVDILKNRYGSTRYIEFLRNLGTLVSLKDASEQNLFVNMETSGRDGNFTYVWKDDIVQVTFHVATLMPNKEQDPNCNEKKKHIGNDYVSIVYNESGEEYNLNTIKGQFNYACIVVQPLELNTNRIFVRARPEIAKFVCHPETKIVSDKSAPLLARQLALHANLASHVYQSIKTENPYASNWLERLRKIKNLRKKLDKEAQTKNGNDLDDGAASSSGDSRCFTNYT